MKKFFEKYSYVGCLLPFIIGGSIPIVILFIRLWDFSNNNIWEFIFNLLLIPFGFIGGINAFRGIFAVMGKDVDNFNIRHGWGFYVYLIITTIGYLAFLYLVFNKFTK